MDFETLFLKYQEEFTKKNEKYNTKKIYKMILTKIKELSYAIGKGKKTAHRNLELLETNLMLEKIYQEQENRLIKALYEPLPLGFDRKLIAHQQKESLLENYFFLTNNLADVLTIYYKGENLNKNSLTIVETLIEIITDLFVLDRDNYDLYIKKITEDLEKGNVPLLEHVGSYEELYQFVLQVLCSQEKLDFKEFQRAMLKKEP